ncbi:hypothetical protein ANCDUO_21382 [Ancylostoma duodenale]|uniref:Ig-like domain-containing protein n=1 Tax=Ancylostoma duodenale TaxID=51022 RepID=A0A0C2BX45_9BILA|nr:hypothetical protein ANCDUO_21382 [Ancylostoma duodenale]
MCRASGVPKPKVTWQRITDDDDVEEIDTESHMVSPKVTSLVAQVTHPRSCLSKI